MADRGPFCETWPIHHVVGDPRDGAIYGAGGNEWFGPAVWKSTDGGARWTHSSHGLAYAAGETPIKAAWSVALAHGRLYAGVEPAGLFVSDDGGASFEPVQGLRDHPSRPDWQPGGAGLILHSIVLDPDDPQRIWVAISAAGVFYSGDGGATWAPRNKGTRADFLPEGQRYPEFGQCVHCLVRRRARRPALSAEPLRHVPQRRRRRNLGQHGKGLALDVRLSRRRASARSRGFVPFAQRRRAGPLRAGRQAGCGNDRRRRALARRSAGLPQGDAYFGVLRQAMATDALQPAGVYFGAGNGAVYASADEGETWTRIAENLPAISSVETLVIDA